MATIENLPPELLHEIFIIPFDLNRFDTFENHLLRSRDLSSFSLVQSRWRKIAQPLLAKRILVRAGQERRVVRRIAEAPFSSSRVDGLTTHYPLSTFVDTADRSNKEWIERWKKIVQLRLLHNEPALVALSPSDLLRFDQLETLWLSGISFSVRASKSTNIRLPRLRRLVLDGNTYIIGDATACHRFFSPSELPSLVHLALDASHPEKLTLEKVFEKSLPHLRTLAVFNQFSGRNCSALIQALVCLPNLQHLSLGLVYSELSTLLEDVGALSLKTLHLPRWILRNARVRSTYLVTTTERIRSLKIERFHFYGKRTPEAQALEEALFGNRDTVWIEDAELPPFENFDGR